MLFRSKVSDVVWGAGGSGYWGGNNMISAVPDQFFAAGNLPDATSLREFGIDSLWSANFGVRHVAYEGGPGLAFSDADNRILNGDARMRDAIAAAHDAWTGRGGDLLVYYTLRGPSEWEFTPAITNASSAKLLGLEDLRSRPRAAVTMGAGLPGRIGMRAPETTVIRSGYG